MVGLPDGGDGLFMQALLMPPLWMSLIRTLMFFSAITSHHQIYAEVAMLIPVSGRLADRLARVAYLPLPYPVHVNFCRASSNCHHYWWFFVFRLTREAAVMMSVVGWPYRALIRNFISGIEFCRYAGSGGAILGPASLWRAGCSPARIFLTTNSP